MNSDRHAKQKPGRQNFEVLDTGVSFMEYWHEQHRDILIGFLKPGYVWEAGLLIYIPSTGLYVGSIVVSPEGS